MEQNSNSSGNVILNNEVEMPLIGLGTFQIAGLKMVRIMRKSIKLGYRSFDTASAYGNEKSVGMGIRFCGKKRSEIFITTKLSNREQNAGDVRKALQNSMSRLGIDYLNLYLMHWPNPETYLQSWKQMEKLYKNGLVRSIGVCNFHEHHIQSLLDIADVVPAVNQVELHPLLSQKRLVKFCEKIGIKVVAYTPLARMNDKLINNKTLKQIANKYEKTAPQIILRWDYQNKIIPIPKSSNPTRLQQNISIFDFQLTEHDMNLIDQLNINFRVRNDPDNCDFSRL